MSKHIETLWQNKRKIINLLKTASKFEELDDKEFILTLFPSIEKAFNYDFDTKVGKCNLWENAIKAVLELPRNMDDSAIYFATLLKNVGMAYEKTEYFDSESGENKHHTVNVSDKTIDLTSSSMYQLLEYGDYNRYIYYVEQGDIIPSFDKNYIKKHVELKRDYEDFQSLMLMKMAYAKNGGSDPIDICEKLAGTEGKMMWMETETEYYDKLENKPGIRIKQIRSEDIEYGYHDRTTTCLILDDYDWMHYSPDIYFHTKNQGYFNIRMSYSGSVNCDMHVTQEKENMIYYYEYRFGVDIFEKYISKFMMKHLKHWDSSYAFSGEDVAMEFFNEVIRKGNIEKRSPDYFTEVDYKCSNGGIGKIIWKKNENY